MPALGVWAKPSVLDRVDGRLRGPVQRDPVLLKSTFEKGLLGLLKNAEASIRLSATQGGQQITDQFCLRPLLMTQLKKDRKAGMYDREALNALAALQYADIGLAIKQALSDKEKMVRIAGIDLLENLQLLRELMVKLLDRCDQY